MKAAAAFLLASSVVEAKTYFKEEFTSSASLLALKEWKI